MSEIDRVFARLGGAQPAATAQREHRTVARKGGASQNRVVEVVRLPPKGASPGPSGRNDPGLRAQSWADGFPARSPTPPPPDLAPTVTRQAVAHLMPMWSGAAEEPLAGPAQALPAAAPPARRKGDEGRRVADPFDAKDDGANCLRCGYAIEPGRERRGFETCAGCG